MATEVANKVKAKCLILNHFSQRYKPMSYLEEKLQQNKENQDSINDCDEEELDFVQKLVDEAKLTFSGNVLAAYDLFSFKV